MVELAGNGTDVISRTLESTFKSRGKAALVPRDTGVHEYLYRKMFSLTSVPGWLAARRAGEVIAS